MTTITINVWGVLPGDAIDRLHAAGVKSARAVEPFVRTGTAKAFACEMDDKEAQPHVMFTVGWLLGVAGVAKNTEINFTVEPT